MGTFERLQALTPLPQEEIDWQGLLQAYPHLVGLGVTPQDPAHHAEGDVLTHTKMVCESMCRLPIYQQADADRRFVLFHSALLHDMAKASCTVTEPNGRITSAGHSKRGAVDARILMWRAGVPFDLRERTCRIIANHQVPFHAISGNRSGHGVEFIVRKLSWELPIIELAAVAEADMRGRFCADANSALDNIELFREVAREEGCFDGPRVFADAHTRLSYFRSGGAMAPDYAYFQEPGSQVIMLSGLPACGKDTWVSAYSTPLRTRFHADGGQRSSVIADSIPR